MNARPVLGLTMGDPAGVGPELCQRALLEPAVLAQCIPVLFGSAAVLQRQGEAGLPAATSRMVSLAEWESLTVVPEPLMGISSVPDEKPIVATGDSKVGM